MKKKKKAAPKKVHHAAPTPALVKLFCKHSKSGVKTYTGMAKLNEITWVVGFRCQNCGDIWNENLGKVEAHEARMKFWGPGFSEDVEKYIAMTTGWQVPVGG